MNAEQQTYLTTLREFPTKIRKMVGRLSAETLTTNYIPDEWTVAQVVHHCADSHINSYIRLKLILTEDQPPLKPYREAVWGEFVDGKSADLTHTLALLDGLHHRWVTTFENVTADQWSRTGIHQADGEVSVADLLRLYHNHCNAHIDQIERVLAAQTG